MREYYLRSIQTTNLLRKRVKNWANSEGLHVFFSPDPFFYTQMHCRLRTWHLPFRALAAQQQPIYRRFTDKHHRNRFRTLEREYKRYHKNDVWTLRPTIEHFLVWLRRKSEGKLHQTRIGKPSGKLPLDNSTHAEAAMFHVLACLHSNGDAAWLEQQRQHLSQLNALPKRLISTKGVVTKEECEKYVESLGIVHSNASTALLTEAFGSLSLAVQLQPCLEQFTPWIRSLTALNVTGACLALSNLSEIPAFVATDILLRTPLTVLELRLQLDFWQEQMGSIAVANFRKPAFVRLVIDNLLFYTVQYDLNRLESLVNSTLSFLVSTKTGYKFQVITHKYANSLVYNMATFLLRKGADVDSESTYSLGTEVTHNSIVHNLKSTSSNNVLRAQERLAIFLVKHNSLAQKGYFGIVLAMTYDDREKAQKLFHIAQKHYAEHTPEYHFTYIYMCQSPELLFQAFNTAANQYPNSASLWYVFLRKLLEFDLLTEKRSQTLFSEIVRRKADLIISKDIVLLLLSPINTVDGLEQVIATLKDTGLFTSFENLIVKKYMALLFRRGLESNVLKPHMDQIFRSSSDIACARFLYNNIEWKTASCVGIMLNGEAEHQPERVFELYRQELTLLSKAIHDSELDRQKSETRHICREDNTLHMPLGELPLYPTESCLVALLRGSIKGGTQLQWGNLFALQVAVHEFQKYVCTDLSGSNNPCIYPSNKLWRVYLWALDNAGYMLELSDIIRLWEAISFVPEQETLLLLLLMLPDEVTARHLKHAASVPANATLAWPWPTLEHVAQMRAKRGKLSSRSWAVTTSSDEHYHG